MAAIELDAELPKSRPASSPDEAEWERLSRREKALRAIDACLRPGVVPSVRMQAAKLALELEKTKTTEDTVDDEFRAMIVRIQEVGDTANI
jgi:hypothetical protein